MIFKLRQARTQQAIPVPPGTHSVGRSDDNTIHIDDTSVSRNHARLYNGDDGIYIEDIGSSNGTAVRGRLITKRTQVGFGDIIYFGTVCFRVEPEVTGEEDVPAPGLKPVNRSRTSRKATEKLPVAAIRFDAHHGEDGEGQEGSEAEESSGPAMQTERIPEVTRRTDAQVPEPQPSKISQPISNPATPVHVPEAQPVGQATGQLPKSPAAGSQVMTGFQPPRPEPINVQPVLRTQSELKRARQPEVAQSASLPQPQAFQSAPTASSTDNQAVSTSTLLFLAFGAGVGVGLLVGMAIAWVLLKVMV